MQTNPLVGAKCLANHASDAVADLKLRRHAIRKPSLNQDDAAALANVLDLRRAAN
jgi:hypothetical protein